MRHLLAILLLLAAVIHPIAHSEDPLLCACAHGALIDVTPPALSGVAARETAHVVATPAYVPLAADTELPARAPPVA